MAELNFNLQEALRFWNLCTGYWKTRTTLLTVANQTWYQLPNAITSNFRIVWQSNPLTPASFQDMDFGRANWEGETTTTGGDIPTVVQHFIVGGLNLVGIWPQDAAGNSSMTVDGLAATPILSADTTIVDLGQDEMKSVLDLAQHISLFKEGGKEFQDSQELFKSFLKAAAERSSILRESAAYRKFMGLDRQRLQKRLMAQESTELGVR